ncbi:related to rhamnogalacturonan acetylesterase precursor [Phialocephala subalpina]|uniref:Related to rhamnogalacturonan acetylesterase n=1 Tax=Phialocephala subalpina TaxID=576137 RepID=A0A1L7WT53_9HELO|nr:related to rhamnogalacturonan acetylesterase precursor [Phialocephala subalpina]
MKSISGMNLATMLAVSWGQYLGYSLSIPVTNNAIGGRSARSFTVENRFSSMAKSILPGDIIIIEFGHNDGDSPRTNDNGRSDCSVGNNTIIKTFEANLSSTASLFTSPGASVIISSQTPDNPWESSTFTYSPSRFVTGAKLAVQETGSKDVMFVDHGAYVADAFQKLGKEKVDGVYPKHHVHTNAEEADVVSKAFVKAVLCGEGPLRGWVRNETSGVVGSCL